MKLFYFFPCSVFCLPRYFEFKQIERTEMTTCSFTV